MTIESLGRRGPQPADHAVPPGRRGAGGTGRRPVPDSRAQPPRPGPKPQPPSAQAQAQAQAKPPNRPPAAQPDKKDRTETPQQRAEPSLYDGGSPSANRLGPAKAMRARDVSRPRDW